MQTDYRKVKGEKESKAREKSLERGNQERRRGSFPWYSEHLGCV